MKTTEMTKQFIEPNTENIQAVQHWFASLPPVQQQFAFELWKMIHRADENHVIEVKKIGERLRATLIYLLRPCSHKTPSGFVPRGKCRWN
jgi:hypothetical protein